MRIPDLGERGQGWVLLQVLLIFLIALAGVLDPAITGIAGTALSILGAGLTVAGGVLAFLGSRALGASFSPNPRPVAGASLVQTGVYATVRHPIYGGLILGAFGWGCYVGSIVSLVLAAVLSVVFFLKSLREEAWLVERYPDYEAYRSRTHRFFPGFR